MRNHLRKNIKLYLGIIVGLSVSGLLVEKARTDVTISKISWTPEDPSVAAGNLLIGLNNGLVVEYDTPNVSP